MAKTAKLISENIVLARKIRTDHNAFMTATVERLNVTYCNKRLETLEGQWESIEKNHQLIMSDPDLDMNDDYLRNDVRDNAEKQYKLYGTDLHARISALVGTENVPLTTRQQHNAFSDLGLGAIGGDRPPQNIPPADPAIISQVSPTLRRSVDDLMNYYRSSRTNRSDNQFQNSDTYMFEDYQQDLDHQEREARSRSENRESRSRSENRNNDQNFGNSRNPRNDGTKKKTTFSNDQNESRGSHEYNYDSGMQWVIQHHENAIRTVSSLYATYMALNPQTTTARDYRLARSRILKQWKNVETTFQTLINSGSQYRITTYLTDKLMNLESMKSNNFHSLTNLLNTVTQCISGLINAGVDANHDSLSIFLHNVVIDKVDKHTLAFYENKIVDKCANRRIQDLLVYLQSALHDVQNISRKNQNSNKKENLPAREGFNNRKHKQKPYNGNNDNGHDQNSSTVMIASAAADPSDLCGCEEKHKLYKCPQFLKLNPKKRYNKCKELKRCVNCLTTGHIAKDCTRKKCGKCKKGHNSLLHFDAKKQEQTVLLASAIENENFKHIFLATVIINVIDKYGKPIKARALLDSGSQLNMVSESMYRKLGTKSVETSMYITGVGCSKSKAQRRAMINLESRHSSFKTPMEVFVVKKLTTCQPAHFVDIQNWNIPQNISLADPKFNVPADIDIVIGGELFFKMMSTGQKSIGKNLPDIQNTVFGWVVIGKLLGLEPNEAFVGVATLEEQLNDFWKIEEKTHTRNAFNELEQACEAYFDETTKRDPRTGKFVVNLQFLKEPSLLGLTAKTAINRFYHLENKFNKDPVMKSDYVKFMREYEDLGHMQKTSIDELGNNYYIIPHHAVRNPNSSTTSFRVVFDGSAKSSTDYSLNSILANGPMLQDDLFSIMVRFRKHKYVFSADITKMYRQVLIAPEHQKYQVIVWRENPEDKLKFYKLTTVTYGTTCASYLAIKTLQKLAEEHEEQYPLASIVAKRDFNVDDIMTGSDNLKQLVQTQIQLIKLLEKAGFELHKWCSNNQMLLHNIPVNKQEVTLSFDAEKTETKALGMKWIPHKDEFMLHYSPTHHIKITKRTVLSETAQLFDPLGLVNPVIVLAKIFQQDLWNLKLGWDDKLPEELESKWLSFREQLPQLSELVIKRRISLDSPINTQIHIFSDSSEKAYGAVIYLRTQDKYNNVNVSLICSKSRVAPISPITIPRLELCAATIAAELTDKIKKVLDLDVHKVVYWTDSELVLSWIYSDTSYKTFVANRVAAIKRLTNAIQWKYVPTKLNPADIVSRGCLPSQLLENTLWWNGPEFLGRNEDSWPQNKPEFVRDQSEEKLIKTVLLATQEKEINHFIGDINHRNSIKTWQHVTAYCLRVFNKGGKINRAPEGDWETAVALSPEELKRAMLELIKYAQNEGFSEEKQLLAENQPTKTRFASLTPFIDNNGVIRVGGRLQAANISYEQRHPALLPKNHLVTTLLLEQIHMDNKHAGPQALLAITRQQYWPEHGKQVAQKIVRNCILCARYKPKMMEQIMGDLPRNRVNINRSFARTAVDYAGPIMIHHRIRGKAPTKAYICLFVCFVTKAVHIEAAVDFSTEAFISCLRRFIARRGAPATIYSDNGRNFVGANNQLQELNNLLQDSEHRQQVYQYCQDHCIEWQFMPARSPHLGGLHEASIKSANTHLKKIMHAAHLTYDDLSTVLAEIEAILNSRPLTPLSNNPNDLQPLTARHFLIGAPLNSINDGDLIDTSKTRLWYQLAQLKHEFWNRWSKEYLAELQQKSKWTKQHENMKEGDLVMLKDQNLPPLKWKMARVVGTCPDNHGKIRVVKVHTTSGEGDNMKVIELKRAVHEISPLPETYEEDNSRNIEPVRQKIHDLHKIKHNKQRVPAQKKQIAPAADGKKVAKSLRNSGPRVVSAKVVKMKIQPNESIASRTRSRNKNTKSSFLTTTAIMIIAFFAMIFGAFGKECSSIKYDHNPGLYFEEQGSLALTTDEWKIICYLNINDYWNQAVTLKDMIEQLATMCPSLEPAGYCDVTYKQFNAQLNQLYERNEILHGFKMRPIDKYRRRRSRRNVHHNSSAQGISCDETLSNVEVEKFEDIIQIISDGEKANETLKQIYGKNYGKMPTNYIQDLGSMSKTLFGQIQPEDKATFEEQLEFLSTHGEIPNSNQILKRQKRGWFDLLGKGAKTVIGVLDEDDAVRMENEIHNLTEQSHSSAARLQELINNQTSIQDITKNIIQREETGMNHQLSRMQNELAVIRNGSQLGRKDIFHTLSIQILTIMDSYREVQQAIIDLITQIHHGRITSIVITPQQLRNQMNNIADNIPKELMIPGGTISEDNLSSIYSIIRAKARLTVKNLIIELKFPLITRDFFKLYHILPVPFPHINDIKVIVPSNKFIGVSDKLDRYYMLSSEARAECQPFLNDLIICEQHEVMHTIQDGEAGCEYSILTHNAKGISPKCQINDVREAQIWTRMEQPNHYIYSIINKTTVTIICKDKTEACSLQGAGILGISPSCVVQSGNMEIATYNIHNTSIPDVHISALNMSDVLHELELKNVIVTEPMETFTTDPEFDLLDQAIKSQYKGEAEAATDISFSSLANWHDIHHYAFSYVSLTIGLVILAWYLYIRHTNKKRIMQRQIAQPQPIIVNNQPQPPARVFEMLPTQRKIIAEHSDEEAAILERNLAPKKTRLFSRSTSTNIKEEQV